MFAPCAGTLRLTEAKLLPLGRGPEGGVAGVGWGRGIRFRACTGQFRSPLLMCEDLRAPKHFFSKACDPFSGSVKMILKTGLSRRLDVCVCVCWGGASPPRPPPPHPSLRLPLLPFSSPPPAPPLAPSRLLLLSPPPPGSPPPPSFPLPGPAHPVITWGPPDLSLICPALSRRSG